MKDNNNINFYIIINYLNKEYELLVNYSSTVSQLKKIIITYFKLNKSKYEIYYKNSKLDNNDSRLLSLIFEKDPKPLLYILDPKKDILPDSNKQTILTLFTNISEIKMYEIKSLLLMYPYVLNNILLNHSDMLYILYSSRKIF